MTFQWRGQDYASDGSDTGFAATHADGAVNVIIKISHADQIDVLHEALADFIEKCDSEQHWRAVAAAKDLLEQLAQPA